MGGVVTEQICARLASDCWRNGLHFLARAPDFCFRGPQVDPTFYATGEPAAFCGADLAGGAALRCERKSGTLLRTGTDRVALARLVDLLDRAVSGCRACSRRLAL